MPTKRVILFDSVQSVLDATAAAETAATAAAGTANTAASTANDATALAEAASATYNLIKFMAGTQFIGGVEAKFALTDETGFVCMYFDTEGRGYVPAGFVGLVNSFETVDMTDIPLDALWGIRDDQDRVSIYIDSNGDFHVKKLYAKTTEFDSVNGLIPNPTTTLFCLGDSLTEGAGGTPYPTQLAALVTDRTVINSGYGSQTSVQIAARFGASGITLTVDGNSIPTSGAVNVTITSGNDPLKHAANNKSINGTIAGVYGTLAKVFATNQYSFTRYLSGDAVATSSTGEFFLPDNQTDRKSTLVIWAGRNDVPVGDSAIRTVPISVKQCVEHLIPLKKNFVVLSVLNATNETTGTTNYNRVIAINEALQDAFPYNYLDIRTILATEANGTIPASLMADTIHLNTDGYAIVAQAVKNFLTLKGY